MSPLNSTQQGVVAEQEFAKLLILGSGGLLEVLRPMTDDERRDMEAHIRGRFGPPLTFQVKSTTHVDHRYPGRRLSIHFPVAKDRLWTDDSYYYFFAYLDVEAMAFADPIFLVPSKEVHQHASKELHGDTWSLNFGPSLEPDANDLWVPFRHTTRTIGNHVLHLMEKQLTVAHSMPPRMAAERLPAGAMLVWSPPPGTPAPSGLTNF